MDTEVVTKTERSRAWWEVRTPALFYLLSVLAVIRLVLAWVEPGHTAAQSIAWSVGCGVLALGFAAAATFTLLKRRRGDWPVERAPLAQESDPRLRG